MSEFEVSEVTFVLTKEVDGEKLGKLIRLSPELVLTRELKAMLLDIASK